MAYVAANPRSVLVLPSRTTKCFAHGCGRSSITLKVCASIGQLSPRHSCHKSTVGYKSRLAFQSSTLHRRWSRSIIEPGTATGSIPCACISPNITATAVPKLSRCIRKCKCRCPLIFSKTNGRRYPRGQMPSHKDCKRDSHEWLVPADASDMSSHGNLVGQPISIRGCNEMALAWRIKVSCVGVNP